MTLTIVALEEVLVDHKYLFQIDLMFNEEYNFLMRKALEVLTLRVLVSSTTPSSIMITLLASQGKVVIEIVYVHSIFKIGTSFRYALLIKI